RARDALAVQHDARERSDFEVEARSRLLQHHETAGAPRAETEIVTHQHPPCAEATGNDAVDKVFGRGLGEAVVEAADMHAVYAATRKQLQLLAQGGKAGRGFVRREELARVRLERQHAGR